MGPMPGMAHGGHMMGMTHANDVRYDAYLANDRTLDDPEIVQVEKGGRVRLTYQWRHGDGVLFIDAWPGVHLHRRRRLAV